MNKKSFLLMFKGLKHSIQRLYDEVDIKDKRRLASFLYRGNIIEGDDLKSMTPDELFLYTLINNGNCKLLIEYVDKYKWYIKKKDREHVKKYLNKWLEDITKIDICRRIMVKSLMDLFEGYKVEWRHLDFTDYWVSHKNKKIILYDKEDYFGKGRNYDGDVNC